AARCADLCPASETDLHFARLTRSAGVVGGGRILLQSAGAQPGGSRRPLSIHARDGAQAWALALAPGPTPGSGQKRARAREIPSLSLQPFWRLAPRTRR